MSQIIPETQPDFDKTRIIERPDGFYWVNQDTEQQYGPFTTLLEAIGAFDNAGFVEVWLGFGNDLSHVSSLLILEC